MSNQTRPRIRPPRPKNPRELALLCAAAALDKKGEDPVLLEVSQLTGYADYFLLVSGRSTRQATAVGENVARILKKAGRPALGVEGLNEGRWVLLDFGEVVVHVFHEPVREFYDLDSLWGDAPRVELDTAELDLISLGQSKPAAD
ncbi:MAG: ribosome silencing factor [Proteobacteria bacterium]|nr:ribosome silencing factor [Pseudomonadota bacterium]MBU2469775.1 ribosome silencing factor [Pseudomonadota bacterium]MBU2516822.1 ribosome silencing factor [Pseudomonadota bacterium]